jgi:hypothetical protein
MGVFRPTRKIYPYMATQFFIIFHDLACDCTTVTLVWTTLFFSSNPPEMLLE